jgi:hypothetical protein
MRPLLRLLPVLVLVAGGCGMKATQSRSTSPCTARPAVVETVDSGGREPAGVCTEEDAGTIAARLRARLEELGVELEAQADCGLACGLAGNICEIADELCRLAGDNPGDAELEARCADARGRCERARTRVSTACGVC